MPPAISRLSKMLRVCLAVLLFAAAPAFAQEQEVSIKLSVADLKVIAQALGGCIVYNQALRLLNDLQKQMNDQMPKPETAPPEK